MIKVFPKYSIIKRVFAPLLWPHIHDGTADLEQIFGYVLACSVELPILWVNKNILFRLSEKGVQFIRLPHQHILIDEVQLVEDIHDVD